MEQNSMLAAVAQTLEREFFAKEDERLLEKLRKKEKREALRELVPVEDDAFLERLIELADGSGLGRRQTRGSRARSNHKGRRGERNIAGNRRIPAAGNVAFSPAWPRTVRELEEVRPRYLGNLRRRGAPPDA